MSIRFLKLSLASPESIRSWTERILPNGKRVGKILKGDLIDYKNGLPIRDGLSCERIFGPMVSFTCTCGRFKCIETRGIHIVHDTLRSSRPIISDVSRQNDNSTIKPLLQSSFQTSSNSTRFEKKTEDMVSQNIISKLDPKIVHNEKPNKELKSTESFNFSILQFLAYRQKKMIRFLSEFYYDYDFVYHSNKNETIPSFVSVFKESYNINIISKNSFKPQTIYHNSKKNQISTSFNFFDSIESVKYKINSRLKEKKSNLELKTRFSIVKNLLKPLYKFIFQIYTQLWFDLNGHYNDFIYEKHIFLWIPPNRKFKSTKIYHNFRVNPSFFSKLKIRSLDVKPQKLPIINEILLRKTSDSCLPRSLIVSFFAKIIRNNVLFLQKKNPFFFRAIITQKAHNNWYYIFILQNISYIESFFKGPKYSYLELKNFFNFPDKYNVDNMWQPHKLNIKHELKKENSFFSFVWLKMTTTFEKKQSQNKIYIYWSQRSYQSKLPDVFQFSMKLKFEKTKTKPNLWKYLQINTLYFVKQVKIKHETILFWLEKKRINSTNQNLSTRDFFPPLGQKDVYTSATTTLKSKCGENKGLGIDLFEKNVSIKNTSNTISLLIQKKSILFNNVQNKKIPNVSFGLLKISRFDLKLSLSTRFQKALFVLKKKNRNAHSTVPAPFKSSVFANIENSKGLSVLDKINKFDKELLKPTRVKTPVSIFDSFKKQKKMRVSFTLNHQPRSTIVYPFYNSNPPSSQPISSSLSSPWYQSQQTSERFSSQNKIQRGTSELASSNHDDEDISKPYISSNTKQNIRVYKFKNFPPEEIRYCPYCEVELLPNSIRRYRLGYIEFVSPVTHIWYTTNAIPLLLNLSKTMIEGIASCHEALSSGFPPVYKWSYNGECPTSWTFQMQPLKLPINSVPTILPSRHYTIKNLDSTQIVLGSNLITCQKYKHDRDKVSVPSFCIIPHLLNWEKNFIIYEKRIKNSKANNKEKNNKTNKSELLYNNNSFLFNPSIDAPLKNLELNNNNLKISQLFNETVNRNQNTWRERTSKKTLNPQLIESQINFPYLSWKNISYKFKYLWMFEYYSKKSSAKKSCFIPISNKLLPTITNDFQIHTHTHINGIDTKQHFKSESVESNSIVSQMWSSVENNKPKDIGEPLKPHMEPDHNLSINSKNLENPIFLKSSLFNTLNTGLINQINIAKQSFSFSFCLFKSNYFNNFISMDKSSLVDNYSIFNFPIKSFFNNKKISSFIPYYKKLELSFNYPQAEILFKTLAQRQVLPFCSKIENGLSMKNKSLFLKPELARIFNISNETIDGFWFFNQIPKKLDSHYDLSTATEYEKKREWLKLEGFFEDPSNQKWSSSSQANSDIAIKAEEEDSLDKKHKKFLNETEKTNENDSKSSENLSLPLVLPFLGKNPDNIEFQSNYSNHENFHIDPLNFIIDLFTTQHIWGHSNFDLNNDKSFNKLETNQNSNLDAVYENKQNNTIWSNLSSIHNNHTTAWNNKFLSDIGNINQTIYTKDHSIKRSDSLNKLESDFSLFSHIKNYQKTDFWPSLNMFYIINNHLFSKTYPFLPIGPDKNVLNRFKNIEIQDSKDPKNHLIPLPESYSNGIYTELWSNNSNFTNYDKNYQNFRKFGRTLYYFKLEQMIRLETAFLKNLFYRNKFQKISVLKNNFLISPFISISIFDSINNINKIMLKKNLPKKVNQSFMIGKKTHFMFGFYLNLYGFNSSDFYVPKIKYLPSILNRPDRGNRFFSLTIKYELSNNHILNKSFNRSKEHFKFSVLSQENLKCSLWPLKSNVKNTHQKLYINNLNGVLRENNKNIHKLWPYLKNTFQENFMVRPQFKTKPSINKFTDNLLLNKYNEQKLVLINSKTERKWPYKNDFRDLQYNWFVSFNKYPYKLKSVNKDASNYTTSILKGISGGVEYVKISKNTVGISNSIVTENTRLTPNIFKTLTGHKQETWVPPFFWFTKKTEADSCFSTLRATRIAEMATIASKISKKQALKKNACLLSIFHIKRQWFYFSAQNVLSKDKTFWPSLFIYKQGCALPFQDLRNKTKDAKLLSIKLKRVSLSKSIRLNKNSFFLSHRWLAKKINKQLFQFLFLTPNVLYKFKKQELIPVGIPVSILYDFVLSRSSSLIKNTVSLETKQIKNENQWVATLKVLNTEKHLNKWAYDKYFPAVYLTTNHSFKNLWLKTYFNKNYKMVVENFFWHWPNQNNNIKALCQVSYEKALKIIAFLNFKKSNNFFARIQSQIHFNKQRDGVSKSFKAPDFYRDPHLSIHLFDKSKRQSWQCILTSLGNTSTYEGDNLPNTVKLFFNNSSLFKKMLIQTSTSNLNYEYSLKIWPSLSQIIDNKPNQKILFKSQVRKAKQKLNALALLGFDTTQIEFFGSLKIYAKRRFLKVCHYTDQNFKKTIPFLFNRLRDFKSNTKNTLTQKYLYNDLINGAFPIMENNKTHFCYWIFHRQWEIQNKNSNTSLFAFLPYHKQFRKNLLLLKKRLFNNKALFVLLGSVFCFRQKIKLAKRWSDTQINVRNKHLVFMFFKDLKKDFLTLLLNPFFKNLNGKSYNTVFSFANSKQPKTNSKTNFLVWFSLYENKQKALVLPWKKLQTTNTNTTIIGKNQQIFFRILKSLWFYNDYSLNVSLLTKLIIEPQIVRDNLKHFTMKGQKNMICYAYAIETIQNKKRIAYSVSSKSIKNFESGSKYLNNIQSLSFKISCFSYFGSGYVASLNLGNKYVLQNKSTYKQKVIVQRVPKQISLLGSFKKPSFVWQITNVRKLKPVSRRGLFYKKHTEDINFIQSNYDLNVKIVNPKTFKENSSTEIFKWGERGHFFNRLISYKVNNYNNDKIPYQFKNTKYNHRKNTENDDLIINNIFPFTNGMFEKSNQKKLFYSDPLVDEKQKDETWKGNTNYYACISQITSWGSDHGSWILFLKYIRANIYKGDQLLLSYFNKMNFQMMPRTGSIMLQQLLSQLVLIPKALDQKLESNFISKQQKLISEIDKWQNFNTNKIKDNDTTIHNSINQINRRPTTNPNWMVKQIANPYFHYNSSFFFDQLSGLVNMNKSLEVTPNKFLNNKRFLTNYKTFSMFDGLIFFRKDLQKTIQIQFNNILSYKTQCMSVFNDLNTNASSSLFKQNEFKFQKIDHKEGTTGYGFGNSVKFTQKKFTSGFLKNPQTGMIYFKNQTKQASIFKNNVCQNKYLKINTKKHDTNDTNKYALYAYKIKKPIADKRFRQISQLHFYKSTKSRGPINNWYRLNNFFSYSQTTIDQDKTNQKQETDYFNLDMSVPCYIPFICNDIRILKLIYSLIISFQLQYLSFHQQAKQYNNKFLTSFVYKDINKRRVRVFNPLSVDTDTNKKLFNASFHPTVSRRGLYNISNKAINEYPTSKISNSYYHLYLNHNNDLKQKLWYSQFYLTKKNFLINNGTIFSKYNNSLLQNSVWLRSYSVKYKSTTSLFDNKPWLLKNNDFSYLLSGCFANTFISNFRFSRENNIHETMKWNQNLQSKKKLTNGVFKLNKNPNYSENFYFSNQKIKIYNVLISPLEIPTSRFINFGFPTIPFDFVKLELNRSNLKVPQNYKKSSKSQPLKTQKWSYVKPVNHDTSDINSPTVSASNLYSNEHNNLKINLDNSQKNKLTDNKYLNGLKTRLKSVLPNNFETYEGHIQSEIVFMKLKEIGNYNFLIKKKNTLFKTLILKMNSSLHPLLSKSFGTNRDEIQLTKTVANFTQKPKIYNENFTFKQEKNKDLFFNSNQYFMFDKKSQNNSLRQKEFQKNLPITRLEFFRIWLFVDSVHCTYLHKFHNFQNEYKIDPNLITKKLVFHNRLPTIEHNYTSFPKILQFYEYRKNFLLKKIFKQRVYLTQYNLWEPLNKKIRFDFKPMKEKHRDFCFFGKQSIPFNLLENILRFRINTYHGNKLIISKTRNDPQKGKLSSLFLKSFVHTDININKKRVHIFNSPSAHTDAIKCLILIFSEKDKRLKIWLRVYLLLNRKINCFYDQENNLDIKYEFKPFGLQVRHTSFYSDWKNLKSFKPQISDLRNTTMGSFKNQARFRLLTVPQIFDLKNQNNLLSIIQKNQIPMNFLGPLLFSSSIRPFQKTITFPVLKVPEKQDFWGISTIFNQAFKKSLNSSSSLDNFYGPIINFNKFTLNENTISKNRNNGYITVFDQKVEHAPVYREIVLNPDRPLSSETLFREENLKVSSSYKTLLQKAKILEDYPDPDPLDLKSTCLKLLNGSLPHFNWWNFKAMLINDKLSLFKAAFVYPPSAQPKMHQYSPEASNKTTEENLINWGRSKNSSIHTLKLLSQFIWDGNQNRLKNLISSQNKLKNSSKINKVINKNVFSIRDQTKFENETITNLNDGTTLSFLNRNKHNQNKNKNVISESKKKSDFFSNNKKNSFTDQNQNFALKKKNSFTDLVGNLKSSNRNNTFNYARNLRKLRLQYLRNFRKLRFIEYLKATYIKPEWMILSLLPVLPPDLRPVIANPRGYITGDINTHYQNVIYRNNNIEKLLDTFWIPRKFYNKTGFFNHQNATTVMLSSIKSYFHFVNYLPTYRKVPLNFKNPYSISKLFSKLALFPLIFLHENEIRKTKVPINHNEWLISFRQVGSPIGENKFINKPIQILQSNISKPTNNLFKTTLADSGFRNGDRFLIDNQFLNQNREEKPLISKLLKIDKDIKGFSSADSYFFSPFNKLKGEINTNREEKPLISKLLKTGKNIKGFSSASVWTEGGCFQNTDASVLAKGGLKNTNADSCFTNGDKCLNLHNKMGPFPLVKKSENLLLTHVKKPFLNLFKNVEEVKLIDWKLERLISPMFSKFTTPYFDLYMSPFYTLNSNRKTNRFLSFGQYNQTILNDKSIRLQSFIKPVKDDFKSKNIFSLNYQTKNPDMFYYMLNTGTQKTIQSKIQNTYKALIFNNKPWQQNFINNEDSNFIYNTTNSSVTKSTFNFKLDTKNSWFPNIDQLPIIEDLKKLTCFDFYESLSYNIHYKPLLQLYNHKSFYGSNIGIATGYNKIMQVFQSKTLQNESVFPKNLELSIKSTPVPVLKTKIIRTQALHDSKPLQEMQYSLQKAVDALIDNSQKLQSNVLLRKGRPLKSLSDNLKGKEGRFRQHLLGKRVDYSGRSVIVVGPDLKLYECGIPLIMALRLFQPFLILYLIYRFKIASLLATQLIQRKHPMVINLLKKFIETWPILLNRAPTLHRMNIQAFKIRLVQGKAILLHPLVCSSYNADFDGDQMGVHVPITQQARAESWKLLWSINNSIAIASRQPLFLPSQDMVIGNYYLTAPPIDNNLISLIPKRQWILNLNIENETQFSKFSNLNQGSLFKNSTSFYESTISPIVSRQWLGNFQKMNHYFFSLEEAYQYYLNTVYHFHVNTAVWFRFCMIFETSERDKPIEMMIDKYGNTIYTTKYYEKQLKRNRILGKNASLLKIMPLNKKANQKLNSFSNINKIITFPFPIIFNKNLKPILLNQIIRSTFGRIEFYYEAFYGSRSELMNNS